MSTPQAQQPAVVPPWAHRSWVAAYAVLALALIWVFLSWAGVLVVVGSTVLPVWAAAPALVVAGTAIRLGLVVFRVPRPAWQGSWRWALPAVTATAWLLVPVTAVVQGVGQQAFTVAEPAGSGGCRAVVAEGGFLFAGSGSVHVAGGWGPFAPQVGSYTTDDGLMPVSTGSYGVSWDDQSGGLLSVGGVVYGDGDGGGSFTFGC